MGQIEDVLKEGNRITLDTNIFIYLLEEHPKYLPLVRSIFESIESGSCIGFVSVLSLGEILVQPIRKGNDVLEKRYKMLFNHFPNLTTLPIDFGTMEIAASIRAKHNLKLPDSIIAATSIKADSRILITNDIQFKQVPDLRVVALESVR